jgi:FkbM family methyltransferase
VRIRSHTTFVGSLLRLPLRAIPASAKVRVLTGPLRGAVWIRGAATHKCWLGAYEHKKAKLFANHIDSGNTVFDVGAHVGFYTILAARRTGSGGEVAAFEPLPRNVEFLRRHVHLNKLSNVTVVQAAVAESDGSSGFSISESFFEGYLDERGPVQVQTVSLDTFVEAGNARLPNVIKIDVEGAELEVLKGARRVLTSARPIIFVATHGQDVHRACCSFLSSMGYSVAPIDTDMIDASREVLAIPAGGQSGRIKRT